MSNLSSAANQNGLGVTASWKAGFGVLRAGVHFNKFNSKFETFTWDNPFRVTDSNDPSKMEIVSLKETLPDNRVLIKYQGVLPDTFQDGAIAIAEGERAAECALPMIRELLD